MQNTQSVAGVGFFIAMISNILGFNIDPQALIASLEIL